MSMSRDRGDHPPMIDLRPDLFLHDKLGGEKHINLLPASIE